jgi:holin-like protein
MTIARRWPNPGEFIRRNGLPQIALLLAFWLAGEMLVRLTGAPLPGGLLGLGLLLALLATRRLDVRLFKRGADWFLAEMLLFFVPAVLAVLDHRELFGLTGLKILLVIAVSTAAVMLVTAIAVEIGLRTQRDDAR